MTSPLPAIADIDAFQARLGQTLVDPDLARATAALADVSAMARSIAEQQWPDAPTGVPDDVVAIALAAARRIFTNPDDYISGTTGPFTGARASATVGVMFTAAELVILKKARPKSGLWTLRTTRGRYDWETGFVNDQVPGSDPIAWYSNVDPGYESADHYPGP